MWEDVLSRILPQLRQKISDLRLTVEATPAPNPNVEATPNPNPNVEATPNPSPNLEATRNPNPNSEIWLAIDSS